MKWPFIVDFPIKNGDLPKWFYQILSNVAAAASTPLGSDSKLQVLQAPPPQNFLRQQDVLGDPQPMAAYYPLVMTNIAIENGHL